MSRIGTCPNRGCTPKKVLIAAAHALHEIETAEAHGIDLGIPTLDWGRMIDREKGLIAAIPDQMAGLAERRGDRDGIQPCLRAGWNEGDNSRGAAATIEADRVVNGTGRVANVDGLNLDAANVRHDGVRIEVDAALRSVSNPAVSVCGDALVGTAQLSPVATYEGQVVGRNIVNGADEAPEYQAIPSAVYTVPMLASVGLTEQQATDAGPEFSANTSDMSAWFSARTYAETTAWSKVLIETSSDRILGAHIIGHSG